MVFNLFQFFQYISLITAIYCFKGLKHFKLGAFIPQLILVCITEFIAANYRLWGWKSNYIVYNFYFILSTPLLMYIQYNMLLYKGTLKLLYIIFNSFLVIFLIYNAFFLQGLYVINTNAYFTAMATLIIFSFLAIARLFFEDDATIMLNEHPYFWINAATVIFGLGALFIMGLSGYIKEHRIQIHGKNIYGYVTKVFNYILYSGYIYAFYLCRKLTAKLS